MWRAFKKAISFLLAFSLMSPNIISSVFANDFDIITALDKLELSRSTPYNSLSACQSDVDKNNIAYPSFKRTECLKDQNESYYYFLYTPQMQESVDKAISSNSSETITLKVKTLSETWSIIQSNSGTQGTSTGALSDSAKNKADILLQSLENKKSSYWTDKDYIATLLKLNDKLDLLKDKYSNPNVLALISYLEEWITAIIESSSDNSNKVETSSFLKDILTQ